MPCCFCQRNKAYIHVLNHYIEFMKAISHGSSSQNIETSTEKSELAKLLHDKKFVPLVDKLESSGINKLSQFKGFNFPRFINEHNLYTGTEKYVIPNEAIKISFPISTNCRLRLCYLNFYKFIT